VKRRGFTEQASQQLEGRRVQPRPDGIADSGPYAVICRQDARVFLTEEEYRRQLSAPDFLWTCPKCGAVAEFDDETWEKATFGEDPS
jgi:hypothetical protein